MRDLNNIAKQIGLAYKNGDKEKAKVLGKKCTEIKNALMEKMENEILDRCIKKENLEDGAWYECDDEGLRVARRVGRAKWNKEKGKFLYKREKFGNEFEDEMDYFGDAIKGLYAGFPPMWKVEE